MYTYVSTVRSRAYHVWPVACFPIWMRQILSQDLAHVEELLRDLKDATGTPEGLMREHIDGIRTFLLDSTPEEAILNVKLAESILPDIQDESLRLRIKDVLRSVAVWAGEDRHR